MKHAQAKLLSVVGALFLVSMLAASTTIAGNVPVGNHSFESVGDKVDTSGSAWWELPKPGDWGDGNAANVYEIWDAAVSEPTPHFDIAQDQDRVLSLLAASPVSQDLGYAVNVGDVITLDFFVGDSAKQTPGDVNATITLGGTGVHTVVVDNDAPDGDFAHKSVQWTATSSGNLGIKFENAGGNNWIDDVGVEVSTAPTIRGEVNITSWSSVYYSDGFTAAPTADGFGGVSNSLPQDDSNSYGGGASGSQTYGVTYADGSAESNIGTALDYGYLIWPAGTASASLDLDMTGAPLETSAEGLTSGGFGGTTFDGSDSGGVTDGYVTFTVDFTIDALAAGSDVDGAFGIQVDVFSFTWGDLVPDVTPFVTGSSIDGQVDMAEETRTDELGDAWTFALTAADIAALGGSVDGTYTAHFNLIRPTDNVNHPIYTTITAFALGEAEVVPEPASLALFGLGGLMMLRRRRA